MGLGNVWMHFDFSKYDRGGRDAKARDFELTGEEIELARKDGWDIELNSVYTMAMGTPNRLPEADVVPFTPMATNEAEKHPIKKEKSAQAQKVKEPLKTYSGDYRMGMTKEEAVANGTYEKKIGLDFVDIDKYPPYDILDYWEIREAREKESLRTLGIALGQVAAGTLLALGAVNLEIYSGGTATPVVTALAAYSSAITKAGMATTASAIPTAFLAVTELRYAQGISDNTPQTSMDAVKQTCIDLFQDAKEFGERVIGLFKK